MAATEYWQTVTDPTTGKAFTDQSAYSTWAAANPEQDAFAKQHYTGYNFSPGAYGSGTYTQYQETKNNDLGSGHSGMIDFGAQPIQQSWAWSPNAITSGGGHSGFIDPATGKIYYSDQNQTNPLSGPGFQSSSGMSASDYYYDQDYGMGPDYKGIIPIGTDQNGTPNAFYAGTPGGGGHVFNNIQDAQASVAAYGSWYDSQHPAGTQGTQIAPSAAPPPATTTAAQPGVLTTPGPAETYFDSTKDFYTKGTPTADAAYKDKPTQPTDAEQYWNSYSGQYQTPGTKSSEFFDTAMGNYTPGSNASDLYKSQVGALGTPTDSAAYFEKWKDQFDPAALKAMYDRQELAAQNTLDRKAASGGWGDSGAAARATGNLSQQFEDAYLKSLAGWATTGGALASGADTSTNNRLSTFGGLSAGADTGDVSKLRTYGDLASTADQTQNTKALTGNTLATSADTARSRQTNDWLNQVNTALGIDQAGLSRVTAGQNAAIGAQSAQEGRLTGGFDRSMAIANNMASLTSSGLSGASAQTMAYNMADLQMQLAQGNMTYAQSEAKLKEYAAAMGVTGQALTSLMGTWKAQNGGTGSSTLKPNQYT